MDKIKTFLIILVLAGSLWIRFHNYTVYPHRGATSDEFSYSFLGVSLLTKHVPISWSYFSNYENRKDVTIRGIFFPIVQPYFDHPPLYGLLSGGWALLFGQNTFEKIEIGTIRIIPILLSLISSVFIYKIAKKLYGFKVSLWSLLIYNSVTMFIMNTRVAVSENLLTMFFLLCVFICLKGTKKLSIKSVVLLGVIAGLSLLTKMVGLSVFLFLLSLFLYQNVGLKKILVLSSVFLVFALLLLGYGAFYDFDLFLAIQSGQSITKEIGPDTILSLFIDARILHNSYYDGWYIVGLISLFFLFAEVKKHLLLVLPSFVYLLILLLTISQHGYSGWYLIPLFPFMAIATSYILNKSLEERSWLYILFVIVIGTWFTKMFYAPAFGLDQTAYRVLLLLLVMPFFISFLFGKGRIYSLLGNLWFYIFIIGNILLTNNYIHDL